MPSGVDCNMMKSQNKLLRVLVLNDDEIASMFLQRKEEFKVDNYTARDVVEGKYQIWGYDLVVFGGGTDVSPELYGEHNLLSGQSDRIRDFYEICVYKMCINHGVPMAGICRGSQFLCVMEEGSLFQHVTNHAIGGTHRLYRTDGGSDVHVTSTHHQMMRPTPEMKVLGVANQKSTKWSVEFAEEVLQEPTDKPDDDIEVVVSEDNCVLMFQPHPEYGFKECEEYFFELLSEYCFCKG